jgi:hypothetical protein
MSTLGGLVDAECKCVSKILLDVDAVVYQHHQDHEQSGHTSRSL